MLGGIPLFCLFVMAYPVPVMTVFLLFGFAAFPSQRSFWLLVICFVCLGMARRVYWEASIHALRFAQYPVEHRYNV